LNKKQGIAPNIIRFFCGNITYHLLSYFPETEQRGGIMGNISLLHPFSANGTGFCNI
jgi:hypothetical protein